MNPQSFFERAPARSLHISTGMKTDIAATWDPGFFRMTRHIARGEWVGDFATASAAIAAARARGGAFVVSREGEQYRLHAATLDHLNLPLTARSLAGSTLADGQCASLGRSFRMAETVVAIVAADGSVVARQSASSFDQGGLALGASGGAEAARRAALGGTRPVVCALPTPVQVGVKVGGS